ncbi:ferrous iron transport protein A [Methanococcus maripaludis]|uniref:FeoA domain protein n=1 Tax=Methanococcus maripaludis TaxID=39152 RepID=A0A2L1C8R2_METMI|nr:FeoA family protein [Methanococcus maripaludis]AVB75768.1 FeoA domain protein [Methanococcus maripaludis]MBA2841156.1 ferrous iron transport protein A [Methanococcus maripaludis]MBA2853711.1 ferrous iron transport protein A [Methanococcus maripaludis]MBA2860648.1 ferrous iron transport protein A [Methanococcus maripaludis]MBA2864183.1 ferrous iron transport protein A [Methanococcus maripaludis]
MENLLLKDPGSYMVVKVEGHCRKFYELGILPGCKITLISRTNRGPVLIRVGNSKVALGRGMAESIFVE